MIDWIDIKDSHPGEDNGEWYKIKKGAIEVPYSVKFWKGNDCSYFVNILFEKENGVTHWRVDK